MVASTKQEKKVEREGISGGTINSGGEKSKATQKKSQIKEGMRDETGQEMSDKGKRSNATEKGQKGEEGQGKDGGKIPSHNRGDTEDGQHKGSSVHKKSRGTGECQSILEKKDRPKVAFVDHIECELWPVFIQTLASSRPPLTPSTKPKAVNVRNTYFVAVLIFIFSFDIIIEESACQEISLQDIIHHRLKLRGIGGSTCTCTLHKNA